MIRYQIKDNLLLYLSSIKLSINKLESLCGFSSRYLDHAKYNIPADKVEKILRVLPDLRREWLLTGEGPMTRSLSSSGKNTDTLPSQRSDYLFASRICYLLKREGLSFDEYDDIYGSPKGTTRARLETIEHRDLVFFAIDLLERYPSYSADWLFFGKGPAMLKDRDLVPIVERPSDISESRNALKSKYISDAITALAEWRYILPVFFDRSDTASFAIEIQIQSLAPILNFGDIAVCHYVRSLFSENWDFNAIYVVERITFNREMSQEKDLAFGRLSNSGDKIEVYPLVIYPMRDSSITVIPKREVKAVAKIIGLFRKA